MLDDLGVTDEFLSSLNLEEVNDSLDKIKKKEQSTSKSNMSSVRIFISQEDRQRLHLLDVSPRELCENYIEGFLNNQIVKKKLNNILKKLK